MSLKRRKWKKKILEATWQVFATPIDVVLFSLLLMWEAGIGGPDTMKGLGRRLDKIVDWGGDRILRNALYNCRRRRLFKENYGLTVEGKRRLEGIVPKVLPARHWDGVWYIANYDIPEQMRLKRDILRENLQHLGFGQLQKSIWISPVNYLGAVEEIVKHYKLEPYVILSETNRIGEEASRDLANKVWNLDRLNSEYEAFIRYWKDGRKDRSEEGKDRLWPVIRYLSILKRDPQLPEELLPDDWCGLEAHEIMHKFFEKDLKIKAKSSLAKIIF